jgi:hypothetical protein
MTSIITSAADSSERDTSPRSDGSIKSGYSAHSGIPDSLTFDRIINGGTCPVRINETSSSQDEKSD